LARVVCTEHTFGIFIPDKIRLQIRPSSPPGKTDRENLLIINNSAVHCLRFVGWCVIGAWSLPRDQNRELRAKFGGLKWQ